MGRALRALMWHATQHGFTYPQCWMSMLLCMLLGFANHCNDLQATVICRAVWTTSAVNEWHRAGAARITTSITEAL